MSNCWRKITLRLRRRSCRWRKERNADGQCFVVAEGKPQVGARQLFNDGEGLVAEEENSAVKRDKLSLKQSILSLQVGICVFAVVLMFFG